MRNQFLAVGSRVCQRMLWPGARPAVVHQHPPPPSQRELDEQGHLKLVPDDYKMRGTVCVDRPLWQQLCALEWQEHRHQVQHVSRLCQTQHPASTRNAYFHSYSKHVYG